MKKIRSIISFEKSFLQNLVNDEQSCVELQEQNYHLALHPYHLTNIVNSIKDLLGQGIAKYDKKLHGILLGYENIKLLTEGTIADDSFFVHIDVTANFYLFKPEVDKILVGVVNKKSQDHVGCLVYETFNVSIPKPEDEDVSDWMGSKVDLGDEILFKITFLKLEARLPYIRGELIKIPNKVEDDSPEENIAPKKKSKSKKSKKKIQESEDEVTPKKRSKIRHNGVILERKSEEVSVDEIEVSSSKKRSRKKSNDDIEPDNVKKKHRKSHKENFDASLDHNSVEMDEDEAVSHRSVKHKKKKSLPIEEEEGYEHVEKKKKKKKKKENNSIEDEEVTLTDFTKISNKIENQNPDDDTPKHKSKSKKSKKKIQDVSEDDTKKRDVVERKSEEVSIDNDDISSAKKRPKKESNDDVPKKKRRKSHKAFDVSLDNNSVEIHEDEVVLHKSVKHKKKKSLFNGEDYGHVEKTNTKKNEKNSIKDEVTSDFDNSRRNRLYQDSQVMVDGSSRKKKKNKEKKHLREDVDEVTSDLDYSISKKSHRDSEVTANDSLRKKKKKKGKKSVGEKDC